MIELIECIPNISEGRDQTVINTIAQAIRSTAGVQLLNVDTGYAANRTVFTFIGESDVVLAAAKSMIHSANDLIDMSHHSGEHPRMGAVDVCPFVPVSGISSAELAEKVSTFAKTIGEELQIPIFLYEQSAAMPHRKRLEQIRKGEYEGLANKMKLPEWQPNYGSTIFNARFGAMVTGVRNFLIAYNINLNTQDASVAKKIAGAIRESGVEILDENGMKTRKAGVFKNLKAIGWYIDDFKCAQVSMNLTDFTITGLGEVFDTVNVLANNLGTTVNGSELIGLVPSAALKSVAFHYNFEGSDWDSILFAQDKLGLNSVKSFSANKQVLEIAAGIMDPL